MKKGKGKIFNIKGYNIFLDCGILWVSILILKTSPEKHTANVPLNFMIGFLRFRDMFAWGFEFHLAMLKKEIPMYCEIGGIDKRIILRKGLKH